MPSIKLGPGECPDIETGARFFAALAFPAANESRQRADAIRALAADYLHEANRVDGSTEPFADARLNSFVELDPKWCRGQLRTLRRRLRDRSFAARAVRPWVREWTDDPHPPVNGIKKFSQRQIALYLCGDNPELAQNFQNRVWRPSRPVLHVAITYDLLLTSLGSEERDFQVDLANTRVVEHLVERAALVQDLISSDPRFGRSPVETISFEWVA